MYRTFVSLALALAAGPTILAADEVLRPRDVKWDEAARAVFDDRWRLPSLRVPEGKRRPPDRVDLLREMKSLASRKFPYREGEPELAWTRSFGDIVKGLRETRDDPARRRRMLQILRRGRPSVWKAVGDYLPELAHDDRVRGAEWDPDDDEPDDGLLVVEPFDRTAAGTPPWTGLGGTTEVHQGATLVYADLEALKTSENDFAKYSESVGAGYEYIYAVRGTYIRGRGTDGQPRTALRVLFGNDISFPYGTFDCDLRVLTSLDEDGHLVTDVYSTCADVYWLAGQSVSIPVFDSSGSWVALLQVLVYGIDLRGVPDGDGTRRAIVRGNLGNLKRRAERAFAEYGGAPRTVRGAIPEVVVRGVGAAPEKTKSD